MSINKTYTGPQCPQIVFWSITNPYTLNPNPKPRLQMSCCLQEHQPEALFSWETRREGSPKNQWSPFFGGRRSAIRSVVVSLGGGEI